MPSPQIRTNAQGGIDVSGFIFDAADGHEYGLVIFVDRRGVVRGWLLRPMAWEVKSL